MVNSRNHNLVSTDRNTMIQNTVIISKLFSKIRYLLEALICCRAPHICCYAGQQHRRRPLVYAFTCHKHGMTIKDSISLRYSPLPSQHFKYIIITTLRLKRCSNGSLA
jgi:hypothetical protein